MNLTPEPSELGPTSGNPSSGANSWLTPEQMNEAVEAVAASLLAEWPMVAKDLRADWDSPFDRDKPGVPERWLARHALDRALPVLFAAWQEQTAAKAGENPVPDEAGAHAQQAWDEGVVAGAAAATAAERERNLTILRRAIEQSSVRREVQALEACADLIEKGDTDA